MQTFLFSKYIGKQSNTFFDNLPSFYDDFVSISRMNYQKLNIAGDFLRKLIKNF